MASAEMGEEKGKILEMMRGLGVQKKTSRSVREKRLFKKVAEYLTSDSYMYAPLVSLSVPHVVGSPSVPPKIHQSSSTRKEVHLVKLQKLFDS
ncbi:hypothetical protein H6P81_000564 [Aristolochia fimbriata]|uniref:Uncharacterized protein n=1 Tax=Aristolochia fimbriata TaxID=158543 RepID=A0AAV7F7I9_ARIFI|nr:hypothetical protein H6P81_000564 [Aristolochia fimbriata]